MILQSLSSDELIGGYDEIKGKKIRLKDIWRSFLYLEKEADHLIMAAREIVLNNFMVEKNKKKTLTISSNLNKKL